MAEASKSCNLRSVSELQQDMKALLRQSTRRGVEFAEDLGSKIDGFVDEFNSLVDEGNLGEDTLRSIRLKLSPILEKFGYAQDEEGRYIPNYTESTSTWH